MINAMENDEMDEMALLTPELVAHLNARLDRLEQGLWNQKIELFKIEIELEELKDKLDNL